MKSLLKKKSFVFLLFLILFSNLLNAQNEIDSLNNIIETTEQDTIKINALLDLAPQYFKTNTDKAIKIINRTLELSKNNNYKKGLKYSYLNFGYIFGQKGEYKNALFYYNKLLRILNNENDKDKYFISIIINNIAEIHHLQGNISLAIQDYTKALKFAEEIKRMDAVASYLNNIAGIYHQLRNIEKTLEYSNKALEISRKINKKSGIAKSLIFIGILESYKGNYDHALENLQEALEIDIEAKDEIKVGSDLASIGDIYLHKKEYKKSLEYYRKSLKLFIKNDYMVGISKSYNDIARLNYLQKKLDEAKKNAIKSLVIAQKVGLPETIQNVSSLLYKINKTQKKWKQAIEMCELYIKMRDSIQNNENKKATFQQQIKYEYEKQHALDSIDFKKKMEIRNLESKQAKKERNFVILVLVLMFILVLFILITYIQKKRANVILSEQKYEIQEKNKELNKQKKEIQLQADNLAMANIIITKEKEKVDESHKKVNASINYASIIQDALLPPISQINNTLGESFVLFKPKETVSGDFYWYKEIGDNIAFAVADSTGHGVPGAFMSMLGIAFLNEIVTKDYFNSRDCYASKILNDLRDKIKKSFRQTDNFVKTQGGMDIAIILLNKKTMILQYAGAYNSLYIIRNGEISEVEADKMPVGVFVNDHMLFTNKRVQLQENDVLYMFSDGYQDQYGGADDKRYMKKRLKELLNNISSKPMIEQKQILEKTLKEWQGKTEQVDDILVVGIKIKKY